MTLQPRPSDQELLRIRDDRVNGVTLGPDSPLRVVPKPIAQRREPDAIDPSGKMNRTERQRALELEARRRAGEILTWSFDSFALRLADATFYHPDFLIVELDRTVTIEETKGHWRDDARVKIKVAARLFPQFRFRALRKLKKKQGGGWNVEDIRS